MMQLPDDFCRQTIAAIGEEEFGKLAEALSQPAPTSIRVNAGKANAEELEVMEGAERVPWCDNGYYLPQRPQFTFDPLLHSGCYYVQEASSMHIGKIIRQHFDNESIVALDACAAPGGKSTLALDCMPEGSLLVANEYVRQRANILVENLMKWGNPNVIVTNSDTADFARLAGMFDLIICDAPCSGEGMFRKDSKAIDEWSLDNVNICQMRQREIVRNLWHALKAGGLFIYSTCTFNRYENEDNVAWMQAELGATLSESRHFYPHESKGEGFFMAVFTKNEDEVMDGRQGKKKKKDGKGGKGAAKIPAELKNWLADAGAFTFSQSADGTFSAFPSIYNNVLGSVAESAHVIHYGIQVADTKGKQVQPCHNLAMSLNINMQEFSAAEVDYTTAIAYLRGEAIVLPPDCPKGIVAVCYKHHPLGFAKNIGNRANNLYPAEWRIKTTHVPTK